MKNASGMFIFLALVFPVFALGAGLSLSDKDAIVKTQFETGESIYIEGICLPSANQVVKIYIANDKTWQIGENFTDVSMGIETFEVKNGDGQIDRRLVWNRANQGEYDVIVDTNNNQILDAFELQCVIGQSGVGFRVGNPAPVSTPTPVPTLVPTLVPTPVPTAVPTAVPTPVSTEPSESFSLGEYVEVKSLSNVRETPGGTLVGSQDQYEVGIVVDGPVQALMGGISYWFWNIDFDSKPDGWVAEKTLKSSVVPTSTPTPEPTEDPDSLLRDTVHITEVRDTAREANEVNREEPEDEKMTAQVSDAGGSVTSALIVGVALFFGLVLGSTIISSSLKRK